MRKFRRYNTTNNRNVIVINEDADFEKYNDFNDEDEDQEMDFDDSLNEADGDNSQNGSENEEEPPMSEEKLKIESLKIATNICKLMNNVFPEDVIKTAGKVAEFIRNNGQTGFEDTDASDDYAEEEEDHENTETREERDFEQ